jgi:hypothetical protein
MWTDNPSPFLPIQIYPVEKSPIFGRDEEKMFIPYSCPPAGREGGVQSLTFSNGVYLLWMKSFH